MKKRLFSMFAIVGLTVSTTLSLSMLTACDDDDDDELTEDVSDTDDDSDTDDSSTTPGTAIDLGLSVKWSDINIGATLPADYGNYYAWGEIVTKQSYTLVKSVTYEVSSIEDFSGDATYDAATANWGSSWRMPTKDECQELIDDCTWTWITQEDSDGTAINGYKVEGTNGNTIFLTQSSGYWSGPTYYAKGGAFWTSTASEKDSTMAFRMYINADSLRSKYVNYADIECLADQSSRHCGWPVRPVSD